MVANWWYRRGGLGAVMLDESAELEARGHAVLPFAAAHPDNLPSAWARFFPAFLETERLGEHLSLRRRATTVGRLVHNGDAARRFDAFLREARPDVVHLHNTVRQLSPSILGVARRRGIPVVMTLHDYGLVCPQGQLYKAEREACAPPNCLRGNVLHAVSNRCIKRSLAGSLVAAGEHFVHRSLGSYVNRAERLISPSRFLRRVLVSAGIAAARMVVLPNGLPDAPATPLPARGGHVLFAGRLAREKGLDVLLDAARLSPEVTYIVAGDGPLRTRLAAEAPRNVRLVGHASPAELEALREASFAVAVPSTWYENAPLSVLEAMRSARPVVASARGGHVELLSEGGGTLVAPGDAAALARAIGALWSDRRAASEAGHAGRQAFERRYRLDDHVRALIDLYAEVAGH